MDGKLKMLSVRAALFDRLAEIAKETRRKAGPLAEEILTRWVEIREADKKNRVGVPEEDISRVG